MLERAKQKLREGDEDKDSDDEIDSNADEQESEEEIPREAPKVKNVKAPIVVESSDSEDSEEARGFLTNTMDLLKMKDE